jgi:1-acyl-sn-glycerol-3-phosphate acyltransferase
MRQSSASAGRTVKADGAGKLQTGVRTVVRPVSRRLWKFELAGFENIPSSGPAILAANHISFLDSLFMMMLVNRNISFLGKAEYMDSWKTKFLFPAMGMIPIDRRGGDKSQAALHTAERVLEGGQLFGIFPEGTRSRDGVLHKGRTGAARLALEVGCPIIPVGIAGTREIQPPDAKFPKLGKECSIRVGRPIRADRYRDRTDDHLLLRQITDELMFEIRELSGQDYVNAYADKRTDAEQPARIASVVDGEPLADPRLVSV